MGSVGSTVMTLRNPERFGYCGFFSGADPMFKNPVGDFADVTSRVEEMDDTYWDGIVGSLKNLHILLGGGATDFNMFEGDQNSASIQHMSQWFDAYEIPYELEVWAGGHD